MSGVSALINALVNTVTNYELIVAAFSAAVPEFVLTHLCSGVMCRSRHPEDEIKGSILDIYIWSDRLFSS